MADEAYPYAIISPVGGLLPLLLVVGRSFCGVRVVERTLRVDPYAPSVRVRVLHDDQLKLYRKAEQSACVQFIVELKEELLAHLGTPDAVWWVHCISPFNNKEINIMAEKLKTKTPAKTATKAPAAKKAGNAEGLKKAQEKAAGARAEMNAKKIKFIGKEVSVREGSLREELKAAAKTAKTVGDLKQTGLSNGKNISAGDVSWMIEAGIIELVG